MNRKKIISILAVSVLLIAFCVGAAAADDTPKMTTALNPSETSYILDVQPISTLEEMRAGFEMPELTEEFFEKTAKNITITKTSEGNYLVGGVLGFSEVGEIPYDDGSMTSGFFTGYKIVLPEKYNDIKKDAIYLYSTDSRGDPFIITGEDISKDFAGSDNGVIYLLSSEGPYLDNPEYKQSYEYTYYKGGISDTAFFSDAANGTTNTIKPSPNLVTTVSASNLEELIKYAGTNQPIIESSSLLKVNVDKDLNIGYDDFKAFGFPKETIAIEKAVKVYVTDGATLSLENFSTGDKEKDAQRLKELTNAHWQNGMNIEQGKIKVSDLLGLYTAIYTIKAEGDVITTADITYNGIRIPAGSTIKSKGDSKVTVITPDGKESTMNVALTTTSPGFGILSVLIGLGAAAIPVIRRRKLLQEKK